MTAQIFESLDELRAMLCRECAALVLRDIRARLHPVADVLVRARVHAGDGAGADDADSELIL